MLPEKDIILFHGQQKSIFAHFFRQDLLQENSAEILSLYPLLLLVIKYKVLYINVCNLGSNPWKGLLLQRLKVSKKQIKV